MDTQSTKLRRTFINTNIVDSDTSLAEAKGHRDILPSILAALGKGKITECDPRREFTAGSFQAELAPGHCAVRIGSRVIRAGDADRVRHR